MAEIGGGRRERQDCGGTRVAGTGGVAGYARHPSVLDIKPLRVAEPM